MTDAILAKSETVFLSYARADDDPDYDDPAKSFMLRLYTHLTAAGFAVWWDRRSLPARGLKFTEEIEKAIRGCERFVLVVGPGAIASDYVRAEWECALTHCKPVTPILRAGDYDIIPKVLGISDVNAIDCRPTRAEESAFDDITARLRQPAPIGPAVGVQPLPRGYITRPEVYNAAFDALQADAIQTTVISAPAKNQSAVAVFGMGGIGKSTLAAALAHDCQIRRHFHDGIIWIEVGQTPTTAALQASIGVHFGDSRDNYPDERDGALSLSRLLQDKTALIVLDDVWDHKVVERFPVSGTACRLLITTRSGALAGRVHGTDIKLSTLTADEGGRLLAGWTDTDPDDPNSHAITELLGGHTLAITLSAAQIANGYVDSVADMLRLLQKRQTEGDPFRDLAVEEKDKDLNLSLSLSLSYEALKDDDLRRRFRATGIFALESTFDRDALAAIWGDADADAARPSLALLQGMGLLEPADQPGRYMQHRLLRAYARALLVKEGELDAVATRHFDYYAGLHGEDRDHTDTDYLQSIEVDLPDLYQALEWGFIHHPVRACDLLEALDNFFRIYQPVTVYEPLLKQAQQAAENASYEQGLADTLRMLGDLSVRQAALDAARDFYDRALPLYETIGDRLGQANTLRGLGNLSVRRDELDAARDFYDRALPLYETIDDRLGLANTLQALGDLSKRRDELDAARDFYDRALPLYETIGDRLGRANTLRALGDLSVRRAELDAARDFYDRALLLYEAIGNRLGRANTLQALGDLSVRRAELDAARRFYDRALLLYETIGNRLGRANTLQALGDLSVRRAELDAARRFYDDADELYHIVQDTTGRMNILISNARLARSQNDLEGAKVYFERLFEITDNHPAFRNHPVTQNLKREYQEMVGESPPQEDQQAQTMQLLLSTYQQGGAAALRDLLQQYDLDAEQIEGLITSIAAQADTSASPPAPSTLPRETVEQLAGGTFAVMTQASDQLENWRAQIESARDDFAGRGDDWAIEVVFADALLAILDQTSVPPMPDNPYAEVVQQVIAAINQYHTDNPADG